MVKTLGVESAHARVRIMTDTGPTSNLLDRAVQYTYRLYRAKRDGTPNTPAASSMEIIVVLVINVYIVF